MKILHVSRTMGQGGAEKIIFQLCRDNMAHKQYIISCGGIYVDELNRIGIEHFTMPDLDKKNPLIMIKCLTKIWYVVLKEKIDIIHCHHRMAIFYAKIISIFTKVKNVYTAHNVFYNKKKLLIFALKNTDIIAVGDGVKRNLIDIYGIASDRITVIYNSVRIETTGFINEHLISEKNKGKFLIGNIGRITWQKGIDIFVKAMFEVLKTNKDVLGIIIGDGEDLELIKTLVSKLSISNSILFLGYQKNVCDIIKQIDLVVLSSRWEGFPLTPIETFSQGKTIIASNISGNNEIVFDQINGILYEKENVAQLAYNIIEIMKNDDYRRGLENGATVSYAYKFNYKNFLKEYNKVYNSV